MKNRGVILFGFICLFFVFNLCFIESKVIFNDFEIKNKPDATSLEQGEIVNILPNYYFDDGISNDLTRLICCVGKDCNPFAEYPCNANNECQIWGRQGELQYLRCQIYAHSRGSSEIIEKIYIIKGESAQKDYYKISEDGVKYDSDIFKHFFLLDKMPVEIEMRPTWKSTYKFSSEESTTIENNRKNLTEYLNSIGANANLIYSDREISAEISKEVLLVLLQDRRIGFIDLPIVPNTPYSFLFEKFPRDIKHGASFLLIFLSFGLSFLLIFKKKHYNKSDLIKRKTFALVNIFSLLFYFLYVYVLSNNVCSGKGGIWVLLALPLIIGSLIWEFIHSIKHKIHLGKIISVINVFILIFVIVARSDIACIH